MTFPKTIQLVQGTTTHTLSSSTEKSGIDTITRTIDRIGIKVFPKPSNKGIEGADSRLYNEVLEVMWKPKTDDTYPSSGKTKEEKIDALISDVNANGGVWDFKWGVNGEYGYRTIKVLIKQIIEMETGGEVPVSLVKIVMWKVDSGKVW